MKTINADGHSPADKTGPLESALGINVLRREGAAKLRGKALFVDDLPRDGVWVGGTVRAEVPHARLLGIRCDERFDWDRVVMVTAADIPGENVAPVVLRDQPSLAEDFIRYHGQPVALVAAPDQETLALALESVTIDTSPLEPVFDVDEALDLKTVSCGAKTSSAAADRWRLVKTLATMRRHPTCWSVRWQSPISSRAARHTPPSIATSSPASSTTAAESALDR